MTQVEVAADLTVAFEGPDGEQTSGRLHGSGNLLTFDVEDPALFAGTGDADVVKATAESLAERGIRVRVVHDGVHLVTIGAVSAPWWQRRATGSRRIRVGSLRGAWTSLRSRAGDRPAVLPSTLAFPPPALLPIAPTLVPRKRRRVTTTHDPYGTGSPRLALEKQEMWGGEHQQVWWLDGMDTAIGSHPDCDVVLPDLADHHASVLHDDKDEYVLLAHSQDVRVHGAPITSQVLRSGSRIEIGPHTLSFYREEYADHGRPYYGRSGGEVGRQRSQPPRRSGDGTPNGATDRATDGIAD